MKIIKPMSLGLLYKTYQQAKVSHLVITALGFFAAMIFAEMLPMVFETNIEIFFSAITSC